MAGQGGLDRGGWPGVVGQGWLGGVGWAGVAGQGWLARGGWPGVTGQGWLGRGTRRKSSNISMFQQYSIAILVQSPSWPTDLSFTMSVAAYSKTCFGVPDFAWVDICYGWQVFRNRPEQLFSAPDNCKKLYHATTLSQCRLILDGGFQIGLHHEGTISSAPGIWGCSHPGHALNRACLDRGWSYTAKAPADNGVVCSWDCPVVFGWDFEEDSLQRHRTLSDGTYVWVHKQPYGTIWNARQRPTSIWLNFALFKRFHELPALWHHLERGTAIVCRSRWQSPRDLYRCGHASPMTCGRVCDVDELHEKQWKRAAASKQWFCPDCGRLLEQGKPCTGWF